MTRYTRQPYIYELLVYEYPSYEGPDCYEVLRRIPINIVKSPKWTPKWTPKEPISKPIEDLYLEDIEIPF